MTGVFALYIDCVTNSGKPYLRVAESYTVRVDGVRKNRKRTIRNLGPMARFDDGKADFLGRLKRSFKEGKPIIAGLEDLACGEMSPGKFTVEFNREDDGSSFCAPKNIGYFVLDSLFDGLGIYETLCLHKSKSKIEYDLCGIAKLLIFGRTQNPESKHKTFAGKEDYVFPVTACEDVAEVYRALDALSKKAETIERCMNRKITQHIGRNTEVCFYDVTNYYFEIDENDPDEVDEEGVILQKGLRKKGVSKENRHTPLVAMGLFIDDNGIPIGYRLFPGNATDTTTLRPALEKSIDPHNFGRVIIVADGGLNSGPNIAKILEKGNGYIVAKSTKKSDKVAKSWILEQGGYRWNATGSFKVKSQIRTRKITDENRKDVEIKEKLVCFWSKAHYDRERHENQRFIEYLNSVIANPDKLKDMPKKIEQFLEKTVVDKKTGAVLNAQTALSIDMEKVQQYMDLMGYYTVMTSEIDKSDEEIINKYHGLSRIEDSFRITKSDLQGRPVFVRTQEHINAHFLICFIALTMLRIIQHKILIHQGKDTKNTDGWNSGLSARRIQKALAEWMADPLPGGYYRTTKPTDDLALILNAFSINSELRLPTIQRLHSLKYACDRAFM